MEGSRESLSRPCRIAILGGGVGAVAAAFALTSREGWHHDYSITLYQQGWRLGGKGASGRNLAAHQRIEEHGLHMWWGFYDQAFSMMQQCQEVLGSDAVRLDALFSAQDSLGFVENIQGATYQKILPFPRNEEPIGGMPRAFSLAHYAKGAARWCRYLSTAVQDAPLKRILPELAAPAIRFGMHRALLRRLASIFSAVAAGTPGGPSSGSVMAQIVRALARTLRTKQASELALSSASQAEAEPVSQRALLALMERLRASLRAPASVDGREDFEARWYFVWLDFLLTALCGMLREDALSEWPEFGSLDEQELTSWLVRHGIDQQITLPSALVRGLYDAAFCFLGGCTEQPRVSTAVIIRVFLRMFLCYKGSYMWRMNGGMGDVIFAPLYLALQKRGEEAARLSGRSDCLRFEFFHRVDRLELSADRRSVERLLVSRQATLRTGVYRPLLELAENPLPVWPAEPLYDQLVEGDALRAYREQYPDACPLESRFSSWKPAEQRTLARGQDFDLVLLGTSVAGLSGTAEELIAASARWAEMTAEVKTIRTQAAQLWLRKTPHQMGWFSPEPSVIAGHADPLNSLADMSHVLPVEGWPAAAAPASVVYFCGPMPEDPAEPVGSAPTYPGTQVQRVRQSLAEMLTRQAGQLWPHAVSATTGEFDWELLVAPADLRGAQRLEWQYVRANIDPAERYVLALPGMAKYRIAPGDSGFENLFLAGDWTRTELSFGCVEAATQSGWTAADAIVAKLKGALAQPPHRPPDAVALPRYRPPFAEQSFQPPYLLRGACFQTHVLAAPSHLLQRICDRYLNGPHAPRTFQPLGPFALLMLGYVHSNRSVYGPEASFGDGPESSAAIVLPVLRLCERGPEVGLFPICAVVDNSLSMATGREVFGFAKQIGWFDGNLQSPGEAISVETLVFAKHHPSSRLARRRWLTVSPSSSPAQHRLRALSDSVRDYLRAELLGIAARQEEQAAAPHLPGVAASALSSVVRLLRSRQVPVYNLLQVRDSIHPERATLQRVTKGYLTLDRVHSVSALPVCEVAIAAYDSHPVAREILGLPHTDQVLIPLTSFWMQYDATQSKIVEELELQ